jgi:hypothetical protein
MSENIKQQVGRLKAKVLQLQKVQQQLKKENELQKKHITSLQADASLLQDSVRNLQDQNHILKASAGRMGEQEKKAFEQSINKYIREIDKCVTLLSE